MNWLFLALYDDPTPSTSFSINKLKHFYHVCMNTSVLNEVKTDQLLKNLEVIILYLYSVSREEKRKTL